MIRGSWFVVLALTAAGCAVERHFSIKPYENQTVEAMSGDRWLFDLEDDADAQWDAVTDDADVEVTFKRGETRTASVCVRVHRGYDGPSTVKFYLKAKNEQRPRREFTIGLYKRCGDEAFWKKLM